jgi:hypothetical protein
MWLEYLWPHKIPIFKRVLDLVYSELWKYLVWSRHFCNSAQVLVAWWKVKLVFTWGLCTYVVCFNFHCNIENNILNYGYKKKIIFNYFAKELIFAETCIPQDCVALAFMVKNMDCVNSTTYKLLLGLSPGKVLRLCWSSSSRYLNKKAQCTVKMFQLANLRKIKSISEQHDPIATALKG